MAYFYKTISKTAGWSNPVGIFTFQKREQPPLHKPARLYRRLIYGYVKGAVFFMPFYDSEAIEQARQVELLTYL